MSNVTPEEFATMSTDERLEVLAQALGQSFYREAMEINATDEVRYWLVARASEVAKELLDPAPTTLGEAMAGTEEQVRNNAPEFSSEEVIQQEIKEINDMLREEWAEK